MNAGGSREASGLIEAARRLAAEAQRLRFSAPVSAVYNPLRYAWEPHRIYLERFGRAPKRVVFLGMNPGPWGMAQTGVPFGEVAAVRDWMGIAAPVDGPEREHPARPVEGFDCRRSEVSGRRLWGLMAERFGSAGRFFREHFVANYCPLLFLEDSGRNRTPDRLASADREPLFRVCDRHLAAVLEILEPQWVIGIGNFTASRIRAVLKGRAEAPRTDTILHPSPANPSANRAWARLVTAKLTSLGVW